MTLVAATGWGKSALSRQELNLWHHIDSLMPSSVRVHTADGNDLVGMPKPYSVPAVRGAMQEMYYWDTYFTNLGLLSLGDVEQAKNNVADILYLINRFGYMPNGSNMALLNRSQPPYASLMVADIYDVTHDKQWLASCLPTLEKEYAFWMEKRIAPNGLNRYGHNATDAELISFYDAISGRLKENEADVAKADADKIARGAHWMAEAESGWDFNPRFSQHCLDFNPVDLNANLYIYETYFVRFYKILGKQGAKVWEQRAKQRKSLINKYCYNPADGLFYDYDFVNGQRSQVLSGGIFNLLNARLVSKAQAKAVLNRALPRLEAEHGIVACEEGTFKRPVTYQWDYPNCWAAINCMAVRGLKNYGFASAAKRIARKYVDSNARHFEKYGMLYEKYNAVTGDRDAAAEYGTPGNFMGWTAGAVLFFMDYLHE